MSDIAVHSGLFHGFGVFATLKMSRQQVLWNLSLTSHSCDYHFNASIKKSNWFLYKLQLTVIKINFTFAVSTGGHAVYTLTDLLFALIDNFDITNIIWIYLYIRDWKVTSRSPKFQHIEIWDQRSKLSWKTLSILRDFRNFLT